MKKLFLFLFLFPASALVLSVGCSKKSSSADISAMNKEMGVKFCKKMMGCMREKMKGQLAQVPPAMREKMKGMFSDEKCAARMEKRPFIPKDKSGLTADELRIARTCMSSMLNASCDQLTNRQSMENLPGCKEMHGMMGSKK